MFRRTFIKSVLAVCSVPVWPLTKLKEKLSNSDYIKKLLKERKDFSIVNNKDELLINVVRRKRKFNAKQAMVDRLNMTTAEKEKYDNDNGRTCKHCDQPISQCRKTCRKNHISKSKLRIKYNNKFKDGDFAHMPGGGIKNLPVLTYDREKNPDGSAKHSNRRWIW